MPIADGLDGFFRNGGFNHGSHFFERVSSWFGDGGEIFVYVFAGAMFLIGMTVKHFLMMRGENLNTVTKSVNHGGTEDTEEKRLEPFTGMTVSIFHGGHGRIFDRSKALTTGGTGARRRSDWNR